MITKGFAKVLFRRSHYIDHFFNLALFNTSGPQWFWSIITKLSPREVRETLPESLFILLIAECDEKAFSRGSHTLNWVVGNYPLNLDHIKVDNKLSNLPNANLLPSLSL